VTLATPVIRGTGDTGDGDTGDTGGGDIGTEPPAVIVDGTVVTITNPVNVTDGANASVHLIHAGLGEAPFEVVNNDQIEDPLITDATNPGGQLNFDTRKYAFISLSPQSNKLDFIGGYYSTMNRESSATANLDVSAGSSTIVIARGSSADPEAPFELLGFAAEAANPELSKVRVVHAARGFNILNAETCNNCATSALDVYIVSGTAPEGAPLSLSYADGDTGYVLVAPGNYNVIVTEAGNVDNVRVAATPIALLQGSVQTLVAVDGTAFGSSVEFIPVDDLQQ